MPVRKKKGTTSPPSASMPESSELCMPDQQAFHQYLRRLEVIKVPRDREGHFHTQTFERYSRYEPHIARSA